MKGSPLISRLARYCNLAELSGVIVLLIMTFALQFIFHELPCPLCLLQRIGFLGVALGLLLNLRYGLRPSHYSIIILSALFTSFVALRQIALHVVPGTGNYGDAFFDLHLYTWSFIISMIIIGATTAMLGFDKQYNTDDLPSTHFQLLISFLYFVLFMLAGMNVITVLLECGLTLCPANPVTYYYLF